MNNNEVMKIMDEKIYAKATNILKTIYGKNAKFREGQYEAIEATLTHKRTLVVQRTGWGKSLVYFISAKMTDGITVIISPLLVLMDNQKDMAEKIGLKCALVNSAVKVDERSQLLIDIKENKYDIVFTTPETLFSQDMQNIIPNINIGLFVIDECHCISDWGHDFRLEYGRLNEIISTLPDNVAVLGTTATANNRVIKDLEEQFGEKVYTSRGSLTRESLHLEILKLETKAERYAWLKKNINKLPGTGIIYCLTQRDCENLSAFLNENGIIARPYHSGNSLDKETDDDGKTQNAKTIELFMGNKIKVIVATIKLGMGYDKEDIQFVIHFQRPSSLVAYYQQIGRAGRKDGVEAYCYLMTGKEDERIAEYFIDNAFPTKRQEEIVIKALNENPKDGLSKQGLQRYSNISSSALNKTINMLLNFKMMFREYRLNDKQKGSYRYFRSVNPYSYADEHYEAVKTDKYNELKMMDDYINTKGCLSQFVVTSLNDKDAHPCGKCANCLDHAILEEIETPTQKEIEEIQEKMNSLYIAIKPRKRWAFPNDMDKTVTIGKINETGIALAKYGDAGYGEMVAYDKYQADEYRDELVQKAVHVLQKELEGKGYTAVTNVPSLTNKKVAVFAKKVAQGLGLSYLDLLEKKPDRKEKQKNMQNSFFQCKNALESMQLNNDITIPENIILIDDMVDSGWTLTVCGRLLTKAGAEKVFPFCLADSSIAGD